MHIVYHCGSLLREVTRKLTMSEVSADGAVRHHPPVFHGAGAVGGKEVKERKVNSSSWCVGCSPRVIQA